MNGAPKHVVRDPDGLLRYLCFKHAVQRAMKDETIDDANPFRSLGQECGDCNPTLPKYPTGYIPLTVE